MTTTITVKADHGWPVRVQPINPKTEKPISEYGWRVPAGDSRDFIVHSGQDLRIHEIQPGEEAEPTAA